MREEIIGLQVLQMPWGIAGTNKVQHGGLEVRSLPEENPLPDDQERRRGCILARERIRKHKQAVIRTRLYNPGLGQEAGCVETHHLSDNCAVSRIRKSSEAALLYSVRCAPTNDHTGLQVGQAADWYQEVLFHSPISPEPRPTVNLIRD